MKHRRVDMSRIGSPRKPLSAAFRSLACFTAICGMSIHDASLCDAHVLEDGFVERTMAVVVRPGVGRIEYSIGVNEVTRKAIVHHWQSKQIPSGKLDREPNPLSPDPSPLERAARGSDSPEDVNLPTSDGQPSIEFLELAAAHVAASVKVMVDDLPVELRISDVIPTPRHPMEVSIVLEFDVPQSGEMKLSLNDSCFDDGFVSFQGESIPESVADDEKAASFQGAFRIAIKGSGNAMVVKSDTAPNLARATRHVDRELTAEDRRSRLSPTVRLLIADE